MTSKDAPNDGGRGGRPSDLSPARQLENLLEQLERRTRFVRETWHAGEASRLKMLAGQLASLAEGSGNAAICESAAELESLLLAEEAEASAICERVEALILQCKKAASGESSEGPAQR